MESNPAGGGSVTLQSATILPRDFQKTTGLLSGFLDKMTLKSRIEQMYKGLEKQGITPGEEVGMFAVTKSLRDGMSKFISNPSISNMHRLSS